MELQIDLSNRKAIAGVIALICIVALAVYAPPVIIQPNPTCTLDGVCQHQQQLETMTSMIPIFILSGIIIGVVVFFFMTSRIEKKQVDYQKTIATFIQLLNADERKVIQKLIDGDGKAYQSEISRIEGIGKVKSHRIIQRLSDRQAIEIEGYGKTNIIKLKKEMADLIKK
ncbi:MAG: hypothetical protein AABW59_04080 [archaeon]